MGAKLIIPIVIFTLGVSIFLFVTADHVIEVSGQEGNPVVEKVVEAVKAVVDPNADIEPQQSLANPPSVIKGFYSTGWSVASEKKLNYFFDLLNTTELNAIVIDIKDYTGVVSYEPEVSQVKANGAFEKRIEKINKLIKRFHDAGVYVIGRIAVFQDNHLVSARPDLALKSKKTGEVWKDNKGVRWLDTAAKPVWDYNIEIARDALSRGFDEINFDYIRFATDGDLDDVVYPFYDEVTAKHEIVRQFFSYARSKLPNAWLSADLFGEVTYQKGDSGIGQKLEDAFPYFDYIAPMTYPSHYSKHFLGFENSAEHPYEVMKYSVEHALDRLAKLYEPLSSDDPNAPAFAQVDSFLVKPKIRPWIQDFDLGADYTAEMVRAQIQAIEASVANSTVNSELLKNGWMLWNPANVYTKEALLAK